tara:strand:+ start:1889 stop:2623 length:735 start_codon:yes stop_codon:yes gene_type:complete
MITVYGAGNTIDDLRAIVPTTPLGAGARWRPIQHGELVDTIRDEVAVRGWEITNQMFSLGRDGADMAGALGIKIKGWDGAAAFEGMELGLGFIHSNARRKALTLTVGASVACCLNGMCTGEMVLSRPHDRTVNLIEEVELAVDGFRDHADRLPGAVAAMRETEVSPALASDILMEVGRKGMVGWAAVGRVDKEYRNPTFAEHGRDTAWALLNAFTYAARPNINPTRQMPVYNEFREMIVAATAA